jgi:hypothetical protein
MRRRPARLPSAGPKPGHRRRGSSATPAPGVTDGTSAAPRPPGSWSSAASWSATGSRPCPEAASSPLSTRWPGRRAAPPGIVESIRAGLVALKQAVGTDLVQEREQRLLHRALERWRGNPDLERLRDFHLPPRPG